MKRNRKKNKTKKQRSGISTWSPAEIEKMRAGGRLTVEILDRVAELIQPGTSTGDIDRLVAEVTHAHGATSAPRGYRGFPAHCCTSINDVVCHGIPDDNRKLENGDIGWHGDSSRTFLVGDVSPIARRLVADTYKAMWLGIRVVRPGARVGDIGHAIQTFAEAQGYSVVREFTGHGIGREFHTAPSILHFGTPGTGERLAPGMTFTIEPMINLGHWKTKILDDGWTAVTVDGTLSAQFEHTCLVTEGGVEVLTLAEGEKALT
jgi:methionyl aminopeptidase